ncbi:leucine--tRNA ligase [Candidatus Woesearchaeota archaeon]|nr:leucine--tRNA ligase [Candidatus Woesearchaeota archaeon]
MLDFKQIEKKWQKEWEKNKVFQPEVDHKKKKFFVNFPYPYINGFLHVGHLYTMLRVEAFARYKRMQGFNVLYPQGWHATGSPIINAAKRIAENEPKQIKIMKDMGFSESEIKKFVEPKYWIKYFPPEDKKDLQDLGLSIDWRREFFTTDLNPYYDKFVRWQFNKLKEKNYVIKGKFPVVWCPKDNTIVQDHSRVEGEGETPQEFCLVKHKLDNGRYIVTATLRQDTILGITNLYINPNVEYTEIETKKEKWIVGKPIIQRLRDQDYVIKEFGKINGKDLVGRKVEVFGGRKVLILPATFLDLEFGTGIVHSVPSDSADDLISLWDLQKNDELIKKYNLDSKEVKSIKPIPVLNTPEYGDIPAEVFLKKFNVKSQNEREKLEEIKKELYKLSYYSATFNHLYKNIFSKNLEGMQVQDGKELIKNYLLKKGVINLYYQLTGKVVCRCLTPSIIKIVSDQWFIDYGNEEWKELAHKCLNKMQLYPEKSRVQFDYVIDWLKPWACTHEEGLGTRLPWDEKWLIESLSDSTIYMAYYTIAYLVKEIPIEKINDKFFDYIFLGKGTKPDVKNVDKLKEEFEYWYPVDFRNSGKDLIQNHLSFFIFNHVAIFPEKYWPKGIGVNGWTMVDGQKMSKSLGNFITIRDAINKYSADTTRMTMLNGGEDMDDPNWDNNFSSSLLSRFSQLYNFCLENHGNGGSDFKDNEKLFESQINLSIKETTEAMESTRFRTAIQKSYFDMQKNLKNYLKNVEKPNKNLMDLYIETQLKLLSPFIPFITEEIWHSIGNKTLISLEKWPKYDESKIDLELEYLEGELEQTFADIEYIIKITKNEKPKKVTIIISQNWKYELYKKARDFIVNIKNPGDLIKDLMKTDMKKYGQEIVKIAPKLIEKKLDIIVDRNKELNFFNKNKTRVENKFNCAIVIEDGDKFKHEKSKFGLPGKPAIILE